MWWSDQRGRRGLLRAAAGALLLAACGFTPLYAPDAPASRMAGRVEVGDRRGRRRASRCASG